MSTLIIDGLLAVVFIGVGWGLATVRAKRLRVELTQQGRQDMQQALDRAYTEQKVIAEQFFNANEQKIEDQKQKFSDAFMENGRSVEAITVELRTAQQYVNEAFGVIPEIRQSSSRMAETTKLSKQKIDALTNSVDSWQGSINTLQVIRDLVDGIHEKSIQIRDVSGEANLLALNASIEAARAGEHGRGFAVVAECMRDLSNKSAAATVDINASVEQTRSEVATIISGIEQSLGLLTEVTGAVTSEFAGIETEVGNIEQISEKSATDATDAKQKFEEINSRVNTQLESITKLLADTMGEVTGNKVEDIPVTANIAGMKIIDVRKPEEFNGDLGHIDGAELICLQDNFEGRLQSLDRNAPHLFVCRSGGRSARAARLASANGFSSVYNLQGGMLAWREAHPFRDAG